jgi:pyruvate/2-oxoglutarate dehydrogenase complex dihydrolipoamide dehydrogenase (E3) component
MHQAMIALFNILRPRPLKKSFRRYAVPWTVFTDPQVSFVGRLEAELSAAGVACEVLEAKYGDFGAAIAENVATGFVRVFAGRTGSVYGACVVGEGSAEMINEWALIIQKKIRLHDVALLQHSFPSMSCLNKSIGEMWMMRRMRSSPFMRRVMTALMRR